MSAMRRLAARAAEIALAHPVAVAVALALLVALPTVGQPFLFDDHFHLAVCEAATGGEGSRTTYLDRVRDAFGLVSLFEFFDGSEETTRAALTSGAAPWWTVDGLRISFWRPLSSHLGLLDFVLFGERAVLHHLHSVAWYLAMVLAWWLVLRGQLPRATAVLALLLFCVDEAHHMPVNWIANRHALVSGALGLVGLAAYLRGCDRGSWGWMALAAGLFGLGLLGGESALGVMAYAGAHALFRPAEPRISRGGRLARLSVVALPGAIWMTVYKLAGFGAWGSGSYLDPGSAPGEYLAAAGPRMVVLVGDHVTKFPADLWTFAPAMRPVLLTSGIVAVVGLALWLKVAWKDLDPRERATLRWTIPGALAALVPAVAVAPSSRQLLIPGLGGAVVLAVLIRSGWRVRSRWAEVPGPARIPAIVAIILAFMHLPSPPVSWWISTSVLTRIAREGTALTEQTAALLAQHGGGEGKDVFVLSAPDAGVGVYLPLELYRSDAPFPDSWHAISMAPLDLELTRTDARTLEISVPEGELLVTAGETIGRSPRFPMSVGDVVDLGAATVRVAEVGDRGPTRLALEFPGGVDDPSLLLLTWHEGEMAAVPPPAEGETTAIPWSQGPLAM